MSGIICRTVKLPLEEGELKEALKALTLGNSGMMRYFLKTNKTGKAAVAFKGKTPIGWSCCVLLRDVYGWSGNQCLGVFVNPKYRNKGIAKRLVNLVIRKARYNKFYVDLSNFNAYKTLVLKKYPNAEIGR